MKIIEYEENYLEDVRDLLTELEEYIVSIDKDELDQAHPEYHEKMALVDLNEVDKNNGKCYLARKVNIHLMILKVVFFKTDIRLSLNKFQMKSLGLMLKIQ